jgi:hypothetical protein
MWVRAGSIAQLERGVAWPGATSARASSNATATQRRSTFGPRDENMRNSTFSIETPARETRSPIGGRLTMAFQRTAHAGELFDAKINRRTGPSQNRFSSELASSAI